MVAAMVKSKLPLYDDELKKSVTTHLSRIEGQARGIAKMFEDDRNCIEVLQQIASLQSSIRGVTKVVLRHYLERCVNDCCKSGETAMYDEFIDAIFKFAK
jgi:DNA-binding FrmR family transcriptional regulator